MKHVLNIEDSYFSSYADDDAPFVVTDNIEYVIPSREELDENWFSDNQMKSNPNKCQQPLNT